MMMNAQEKMGLLTVHELAKHLSIGRDTAYSLVRRKDFPSVKLGREYRTIKADLPEWLEKQRKNK